MTRKLPIRNRLRFPLNVSWPLQRGGVFCSPVFYNDLSLFHAEQVCYRSERRSNSWLHSCALLSQVQTYQQTEECGSGFLYAGEGGGGGGDDL